MVGTVRATASYACRMDDVVEALRSKPGEFFLAAEQVHEGLRFRVHGAMYEVVSEPTKWGIGWSATVRVVEGLRPGSQFRALLFTGKRVE
jgi:hypothetical protein